jgi:hypothetical protein
MLVYQQKGGPKAANPHRMSPMIVRINESVPTMSAYLKVPLTFIENRMAIASTMLDRSSD